MSDVAQNGNCTELYPSVPSPKNVPTLYFSDLPFEEAVSPKVLEIWRRPQYEQRTEGWYAARNTCISASDVATALTMDDNACNYYIEHFGLTNFKKNPRKSCNKYTTSLDELLLKKCNLGKPFTGNPSTRWGQKYEQIVTTTYSQMKQKDVIEFGLIFHPTVPFLAASPDGITVDATMLEIKCPTSRQVSPVPPLWYFQQMLMQLECCGLDTCDFFDAHFLEYVSEEDWLKDARAWWKEHPDSKHHEYGIIMGRERPADDDGDPEQPIFEYAPPTVITPDDFLTWKDKVIKEAEEHETENYFWIPTYYKLNKYYINSCKASKEWFQLNYPTMEKYWNRILYHRTEEGMVELKKSLKDAKEESEPVPGGSADMLDISIPTKTSKRTPYKHETCLLDTHVL